MSRRKEIVVRLKVSERYRDGLLSKIDRELRAKTYEIEFITEAESDFDLADELFETVVKQDVQATLNEDNKVRDEQRTNPVPETKELAKEKEELAESDSEKERKTLREFVSSLTQKSSWLIWAEILKRTIF